MTHASLFSGIGGPEVAAAMLGWDNAFHCEINPFGRAVLEYWFPNSVSYEDITKTDFKPWRGRIDVLTGGFPCQPFSYAGQRRGQDDDRYLWPQMLRAIDEIRPAWVVGENVAGITTMVEGGVLADLGGSPTLFQEGDELHGYELEQPFTIERICRDLERLGYSVQPVLVPAAAVGAPHRRDRIFILAADADPNRRDDTRSPGGYAGAGREERVQERDEVRQSGIADNLRSALRGAAENAQRDGRGIGTDAVEGSQRDKRDTRAGNDVRVCGTARADAADTDRAGHPAPDEPCGREWTQMDEWSKRITLDGIERFSSPSVASDTDGQGREEPVQPGRGENRKEDGTRVHDRAERPRRDAVASDTDLQRLYERQHPAQSGEAERFDSEAHSAWRDSDGMRPGFRWAGFPSVSPVHAGNDGLPIGMDGVSLPFAKWRTESLKAYGNAIVPQVMYQIFKTIELCQANQ